MPKRKLNSKKFEEIQVKIQKMQSEIDELLEVQEAGEISEEEAESENDAEDRNAEPENPEKEGETEENQIPQDEPQKSPTAKSIQENCEVPLNENILGLLGPDPQESKALDIKVHSVLANRWKYWAVNGLDEKDKTELVSKYARQEGLNAPMLNAEVAALMVETSIKRDKYVEEVQQLIGSALTALSSVISMTNDDEGLIDISLIEERTCDAIKLMAEAMAKQTETRKAVIVPGLPKLVKDIVNKTKTDTMLFGKDLASKIKEAKAMTKMTQEMKAPAASSSGTSVQAKNYRGPQGRRPLSNTGGNPSSSTQNRPRQFFRSKQQMFNPKAQSQRGGFKPKPKNKY